MYESITPISEDDPHPREAGLSFGADAPAGILYGGIGTFFDGYL